MRAVSGRQVLAPATCSLPLSRPTSDTRQTLNSASKTLPAMSDRASSSSTAPSKPTTPVVDDVDIDKLLNREANAFQREIEVERILKAFKLKYASFLHNLHIPLKSAYMKPV